MSFALQINISKSFFNLDDFAIVKILPKAYEGKSWNLNFPQIRGSRLGHAKEKCSAAFGLSVTRRICSGFHIRIYDGDDILPRQRWLGDASKWSLNLAPSHEGERKRGLAEGDLD